MTSQAEKAKSQSPSPPAETTSTSAIEPVIDNDDVVEVDDNDSALGGSNSQSDYTSVASSIYKGVFEHGRRYRTLREGEYFNPVDDQQFESAANNHLSILLADQREKNQFFRSPINLESAQILDIGSGEGQWALDVADAYSGGKNTLSPNLKSSGTDRTASYYPRRRSSSITSGLGSS